MPPPPRPTPPPPRSSAPPKSGRMCPACGKFVPTGQPQCSGCKLQTAKMDAFEAAKRAAQSRGIKETKVQASTGDIARRATRIGVWVVVLALVVYGGWSIYAWMHPPPRYLRFPATAEATVRQLLGHISNGDDANLDQAYALVADSARDAHASDDRGDYLQIFTELRKYLAGEFGDDWLTRAQVAPDAADPNLFIVKVGPETLHFHTAQQTPADRVAREGQHYGFTGMDELSTWDASQLRQVEGIEGFVGGIAGQGAVNNLETIIGARTGNRHLPPFVKKMSVLSVNRNPRQATWQSIIQMYPVRTDPVVRARLTQITQDERYDKVVRDHAQEVLDDKVPEEELISVGL